MEDKSLFQTFDPLNEQFLPDKHPRYIRRSYHDLRIGEGNNFARDAYYDTETDELVWVAVGYDPNE